MEFEETVLKGGSYRVWRGLAISGFVLTVGPVIYGFFDAVFSLDSINFENLLFAILVGIVLMYIGCIGWARYLNGGWRFFMALVLVAPGLLIFAADPTCTGVVALPLLSEFQRFFWL
jgi:hypothetical protein